MIGFGWNQHEAVVRKSQKCQIYFSILRCWMSYEMNQKEFRPLVVFHTNTSQKNTIKNTTTLLLIGLQLSFDWHPHPVLPWSFLCRNFWEPWGYDFWLCWRLCSCQWGTQSCIAWMDISRQSMKPRGSCEGSSRRSDKRNLFVLPARSPADCSLEENKGTIKRCTICYAKQARMTCFSMRHEC